MNKSCVIAAVVLLSINLSLCPLHAQKTIDRTFSVQPGGELILETGFGQVSLRGTAASQVKVHIESDRDLADRIEFTFRQDGNRVEVYGKAPDEHGFLNFLKNRSFNGRLRIDVEVPERFNVQASSSGSDVEGTGIEGETSLRSSGGNVTAERMTGSLSLRTSGGDVRADLVNGPLTATTSGGDVTAEHVQGDCELTTSGGDVTAVAVRGDCYLKTSGGGIQADSIEGSLNARTSGGNVMACLRGQPSKPCELHTSGGNIELSVPESISAELSARTSGGSVKSDLPVKVYDTERGRMEGTLGQGGPALTLRTSGGNIRLRVLK